MFFQHSSDKIAFLGLNNVGKSSIIHTITREFDMLVGIKPTISVERTSLEIFGKELIFWDYGGQEKYRVKYLENPSRYFNDIAYLFYIFDTQDLDPLSFKNNLSYFRSVLAETSRYSPDARIIVLFHKSDPDYQGSPEQVKIKERFLEAISLDLEAKEKAVDVYETSIFIPFSIVTAISQPMFGDENFRGNLQAVLAQFCETYNVLFSMLLTGNFFELSSHFEERMVSAQINYVFQHLFRRLNLPQTDGDLNHLQLANMKVIITRFSEKFARIDIPFYIIIGYDNESLLEESGLNVAALKIAENFKKIFSNVDLSQWLSVSPNLPK